MREFPDKPLVLRGEEDFTYSQVRLRRTDKSKNGYHVWINGVCVMTKGPVLVEARGKPTLKVTVTLAVRPDDLIEE